MKKISKYFNHASKFMKSEGKKIIIKDLLHEFKSKGVQAGAQSFLHKRYMKDLYGVDWLKIEKLLISGLFDVEFYLNEYSDIMNANIDPLVHYYYYGWKEGRNPSVSFDTNYYVSTYSIDINPLFHYLTIGQASGYLTLRPNNTFDFNSEKTPLQEYLIESNAVQDVIVLITHDMSRSGAPLLLLNIARELSEQHHKRIILISTVDGELRLDFECYCHVICLKQNHLNYLDCYEQVEELFYTLFDYSVNNVLANTIGSCLFVPVLEKYEFDYQILIHELPDVIERMNWTELVKSNLPQIKNGKAIYSSKFVLESHQNNFDLPQKVDVIPQGMFHNVSYIINNDSQIRLRQRYNLPLDSKIIFNGGRDLPRKGVDLFYQIAQKITQNNKDIYFIYLCDKNAPELIELLGDDFNLNPNIIFDDFASDYSLYLEGSNIFALTSREDPFPNVMLDSLAHGLPMIAFDKCGGAPEVLATINKELIASYLDINDFANKIMKLITDDDLYQTISQKSLEIIKNYQFDKYVSNLLAEYEYNPTISVIIPNYNYARYLPERINSILNQTYQPSEIIFLDDNSTDDSVAVAERLLSSSNIPYKIVKNDINQGVFKQWAKGINLARSELLWIAEADDFCDDNFLEHMKVAFLNKSVGISYCQSKLIDEEGNIIQDNVLTHTNELSLNKWLRNYKNIGVNEIREAFMFRNVIVNSGSCLIRKDSISSKNIEQLESYKYCGDWFLYSQICKNHNIAYHSYNYNSFRRHMGAVTNKFRNTDDYLDEIVSVITMMLENVDFTEVSLSLTKKFIKKDFDFNIELINHKFDKLIARSIKRKKILFVALNPSAQEGGGADVLWVDAVSYLAKLGLNPSLLVHSRNNLSNKVNGLANSGAKISYFSESGYSMLEEDNHDIVVFIQGDHNEGGEWFKRCYSKQIPYVIVNQLTKEGFWVDDSQAELIRNGYKYAYKTFFTCENNRLLMERQLGLKLTNAERHCNPVAGVERNVQLPFPEVINDEYHLACPSRLITIHKGQDLLFEVLKQEKWKQRKLIINLYGNGPNKLQLEQLKSYYDVKNINFCGYSSDVKDIWRKNHGVIMPSHMEGVPIVLLGAMLCARVPLLTDVGGHRELVEDNVSGFIAKAPTAELIDEALERAWQNRQNWQEIGLKARNSVLKFQSENPVQDFIELVFS